MNLAQLRVTGTWRLTFPSRRSSRRPWHLPTTTPNTIDLSPPGSVGGGTCRQQRCSPHGLSGGCLSCGSISVTPERSDSTSPSPGRGLLAGPLRASLFFKINTKPSRRQVVLSRLPVPGASLSAARSCPSSPARGRYFFRRWINDVHSYALAGGALSSSPVARLRPGLVAAGASLLRGRA